MNEATPKRGDRLERIERSVMGAVLVMAVVWAVLPPG